MRFSKVSDPAIIGGPAITVYNLLIEINFFLNWIYAPVVSHVKDPALIFFSELSDPAIIRRGRLLEALRLLEEIR